MSVYDLSHWQPEERVAELAQKEDCEGFILKVGEMNEETREIELDPKFVTHVNNAVATGKPYGIYYMSRARNREEIERETHWINDIVAEYLNGNAPELGTWWDLERDEVKRDDISSDIFYALDLMNSWWITDRIGIYASYYYFRDYIGISNLVAKNTPVWNAQYNGEDYMKQHDGVREVLWQFTTHNNEQDENEYYGF